MILIQVSIKMQASPEKTKKGWVAGEFLLHRVHGNKFLMIEVFSCVHATL